MQTGYQAEFAYAKSLSQFASKLGPDGWKVAARRLQRVLAPSVPFGQGWIGEHEAPPGTIFKSSLADKKVVNAAANNQVSAPTVPSGHSGLSSTSHAPAMTSSFVHTPKSSRAPMTSVAQTSMDSLLTTVTSAMLASGVSSQTMLPGKPTLVSYLFLVISSSALTLHLVDSVVVASIGVHNFDFVLLAVYYPLFPNFLPWW